MAYSDFTLEAVERQCGVITQEAALFPGSPVAQVPDWLPGWLARGTRLALISEKARSELLDGKPDRAQKDLEKAVQVYPQFAEAWYQLGRILEVSKKEEAGNSFSRAVAADPKFILPYEQLAAISAQAGKWQELVDCTSHELELNPRGNPQTWYYHALGNVKIGKMDVAQVSAEKALAMDPLHTQPNTEQLLAVILANNRDYAGALQHLRNCLTYVPAGPNTDIIKQQIAQLEPAAGTLK